MLLYMTDGTSLAIGDQLNLQNPAPPPGALQKSPHEHKLRRGREGAYYEPQDAPFSS
jgi:hypothetical protein